MHPKPAILDTQRRVLLKTSASFVLYSGAGLPINSASAQNTQSTGYPTKNIRLIVGFPPGGGIDFAARTIQAPLQEALKTQLIIDYKTGAGGVIAAAELTRAPADGYTLLLANTGPFAIAPYTQAKKPYARKKTLATSVKLVRVAISLSSKRIILPKQLRN
jgi:tripartite-type tricarboxylate transporter receptor subunit TctC